MTKMNMTEKRFAESSLYTATLKACEESLVLFGHFNKRDIMKACGNEALTDSMNWGWIVRKIESGHNMPGGAVHLIPVAESFYKAKGKEKAAMQTDAAFPGRYVATGYGKRTAGWVLGTFAEGRFAIYRIKSSVSNIKGRADRSKEMAASVAGKLIADGKVDKAVEIMTVVGTTPALTKRA